MTQNEGFAATIKRLRAEGVKRIYLSHDPRDEAKARQMAHYLRARGFDPVVAADARPHKTAILDEDDKYIVSKVIASCQYTMVIF
ncbi:hypothetical protein MUP01_11975 [Candidatus Bathyarchaeota archaeon]|nr:hypothetical protein [Candidatus Bathyarchaeota archaeon]